MKVAIIFGSKSDTEKMRGAANCLKEFGIEYSAHVLSAHRVPEKLEETLEMLENTGYEVIIAGAGGAAHLPGMVSSLTPLPVIGVPVQSKALSGWDSLLSIVQMPGGIPVGTVAIGNSGAKNAGILASEIIALMDEEVAAKLEKFRTEQRDEVLRTSEVEA